MKRNTLTALIATIFTLSAFCGDDKVELQKGDHLAIIGQGYADRLQHDGWLETLINKAYPAHELVIRNLAFSGDEISSPLQTDTGATRDQWLANVKADVIFAFYGFNESFAGPDGVNKFKEQLDKFLKDKLKANFSGKGAPKLVLFSPIAHEKINDPNAPDGDENNKNLALYTAAMADVAKANNVKFVDLFAESQKLYAAAQSPLTINGIHMTEAGNRQLAPVIFKAAIAAELPVQSAELEKLRTAVVNKSETWHDRYRTVDSFNIFGGRSNLSYESGKGGPKVSNREVMLQEMDQRDVLTANRDKVVWAAAQGKELKPDDTNLPAVKVVKTNLTGANPDGSHPFLSGEEAISKMTLAKGCKITLFASEEQFPELVQPVQMAWDTKGRLWVASWKNYPERTPTSTEGDKLLIFEDTKGVGKADKCTVFADNLNCPTGFQFYKDGVLVMRSPDLLWLRDTNGDDKADWSDRMLMGLDAADSHHETNSMVLDPGGATYLSDGVFHRSQVETTKGVVRNSDAAIYRYEPLTSRFERYVPYGFANPHGRVFDYWGTDIITDATGNNSYFAPAFSGFLDYPHKHPGMKEFWPRPSRPCPGTAFLSSRHFPDDFNGNFLDCNVIGMQGIFRVKVSEDGSGIKGETLEHLLMSSDKNFRPTGVSVAPDGSLYVTDWTNAIIGHMQHHLRDPNRDHIHGRIYRITFEGRALLTPPKVDGEPVDKLLNILKEPEDSLRTRAKIELGKHPAAEVVAAVDKWIAGLDKKEATYEHNMLEALWVKQWHNVVDIPLLKRELQSPDHHARAAAVHVLCYWRDRVPETLTLLKAAAEDEHPRVRIEAVRAASFFNGNDVPAAFEIAHLILKRAPLDYYLDYCYRETIKQLKMHGTEPVPADPDLAEAVAKQQKAPPPGEEKKYGPTRKNLAAADKKAYDLGKSVFHRDAHCITCHQENGLGLAPIYPPLTNKDWLAGDDERLIKIVLKGLWGPLEVAGKRFDPTKGTPPMTGFADLLKDNEIAAVLTYVRQSFGNDYDPIKPEMVAKVRKAAEARASFYQIDELMKENPMPGWEKWAEPLSTTVKAEDLLAPFVDTLAGGEPNAGKKLFFESEKVQCARCHKINGKGADVGPDLSKIAAQPGKDKKYFLESLIVPSAQIAQGYEATLFKLNDGKVVMGIVKGEDDKNVNVMQADGRLVSVAKDQIKMRKVQKESPMPPMGEVLNKQEIRNVIEFLSTLK